MVDQIKIRIRVYIKVDIGIKVRGVFIRILFNIVLCC